MCNLKIEEMENLLKIAGNISFGTHKELPHLMPTVFRKNYDENFISDWLAFILNPAVNSVGVQPLNLLIELLDRELLDKEGISILPLEEAETDMGKAGEYSNCREIYLSKGNRIDLLFLVEGRGGRYLFAIENKVFSGLSKDNQLDEYSKAIKQLVKREYQGCQPIKIYLTRFGDKDRARKSGFHSISHKDYIEKLKGIQLDFIEHMRESFLIKEYIKNMEEYIMPQTQKEDVFNMNEKELRLFSENYALIDTISQRKEDFCAYVRQTVFEKVGELFDEANGYKKRLKDAVVPGKGNWCYWYHTDWPYHNGEIHYEIVFAEDSSNKMSIAEDGSIDVKAVIHVEGLKGEDGYVRGQLAEIATQNSVRLCGKKSKMSPTMKTEIKITSAKDIQDLADDLYEKMATLVHVFGPVIKKIQKQEN